MIAFIATMLLSLVALIFLTRRCASPPQRRVSELLTPRTVILCFDADGSIMLTATIFQRQTALLVVLSLASTWAGRVSEVLPGWGCFVILARSTGMPVSVFVAASMTALVLSLAALIFLTRRCASPPQRLVSELLTPRMGVLCSFILVLFLSEMAVHMGWAGAKLAANTMPVSL